VIALPPSDAGAVKDTEAEWTPDVALTLVGAPGTSVGTKLFDAAEAALVPAALLAVTVHV
jgi:hypothetical protein